MILNIYLVNRKKFLNNTYFLKSGNYINQDSMKSTCENLSKLIHL